MEKRGMIILVVVLIIGFALGYSYPIYQNSNIPSENENSYISPAWSLLQLEGDNDKAIKEFKKYLKRDDSNFPARIGLGWAYYKKNKFEKAKEQFEKSLIINSNDKNSYNGLGWININLKNYPQAQEFFLQAKSLGGDNLLDQIYLGTAWTQYNLKKFEYSKESFESALNANPNKFYPYVGLAVTNYELKNYEEAKKYTQLVEKYPYERPVPYRVNGYEQRYLIFEKCINEKKYDYSIENTHKCGQQMLIQ